MKRNTAISLVTWRARLAALFIPLALAGCGGGGSRGYICVMCAPPVVGLVGTLSGLVGSRLELQDNYAGVSVPVGPFNGPAANGTNVSFDFGIFFNTAYDLTVKTQPTNPSQTCVVKNGMGTTGTSDVTNIVVTCTTNPPRFVYVTNGGSNNVSAYAVDAASGALTAIAGSPFATGNLPVAIAVDPTGTYVFVANQTDSTVSAFTVDRMSGALTAVSGSPFPTEPAPTSVAIDTSRSQVYVTSGNAATRPRSHCCSAHRFLRSQPARHPRR
jgi:6-phosphogluconolactonase